MGYVKSKAHDRQTSSWKFTVLFTAVAAIILVAAIAILSSNVRVADDSTEANSKSRIDGHDSIHKIQGDHAHSESPSSNAWTEADDENNSSKVIPEVKPDLPTKSRTKARSTSDSATLRFYPKFKVPSATKKFAHTGSWEDGDFTPTSFLGINLSSERMPGEEVFTFFDITSKCEPSGIWKASQFELDRNEFGFQHVILQRSYESEALGGVYFGADFGPKNAPTVDQALDTLDRITQTLMNEYGLPETELDYYKNENNVESYSYRYEQGSTTIEYGISVNSQGACHCLYLRTKDDRNVAIMQSECSEAIRNPQTTEVRQWLAQPYKSLWPHQGQPYNIPSRYVITQPSHSP